MACGASVITLAEAQANRARCMGSNTFQTTRELPAEDAELVDLLTAVLVDPNLYTDLRMRLHREIRAILRAARTESLASARCSDFRYSDAGVHP